MTLYSYLSLDPADFDGLSPADGDALIQQQLAKKIAEPVANAAPLVVARATDSALISAYVLQVPELRSQYEQSIAGLAEEEQNTRTKDDYIEATKVPLTNLKDVTRLTIADIRPELITSSREVNFLTRYFNLTDQQIASIVSRMHEMKMDPATALNLYSQPNIGENTVQATFELLRANPQQAHFALYGMLEKVQLSDMQLAEIVSAIPETYINGYDINTLYAQHTFGSQSFDATIKLIASDKGNIGRFVAQALLNTNSLSDIQLSELIEALPDNHELESTLHQVALRCQFGSESATSYLKKLIENNLRDEELVVPLIEQGVLTGAQYAQLLNRSLDKDFLPIDAKLILQRASSFPEIKEVFMAHVKEHRELNTEAFEIVLGTAGFSDDEFATLLSSTNVRWQRTEAEKIYRDHGHRFGPESLDVLIRDVAGIEFRSPQSLERMLYGSTISDSQTAALLEATVGDKESYEMWDVLAEHGTFGDAAFAMMEKLEYQIPNLRPSFVTKLVDSFQPHGIPDHHAATLLRVTKETVLANELRQTLVDRQTLGQRAFDEITSQFSKTQVVDLQLVYSLVGGKEIGDSNAAKLIDATSIAYAGHEVRLAVVRTQPLGQETLHALIRAIGESQYPDQDITTIHELANKGLGEHEKMVLAGAFRHPTLIDQVNQILGVNGSGQNFGQGYRGW